MARPFIMEITLSLNKGSANTGPEVKSLTLTLEGPMNRVSLAKVQWFWKAFNSSFSRLTGWHFIRRIGMQCLGEAMLVSWHENALLPTSLDHSQFDHPVVMVSYKKKKKRETKISMVVSNSSIIVPWCYRKRNDSSFWTQNDKRRSD